MGSLEHEVISSRGSLSQRDGERPNNASECNDFGLSLFFVFLRADKFSVFITHLLRNDTAPLTRYHACIYGVVYGGGEERIFILSYLELNAWKESSGGYRLVVSNAIPRVAEGCFESD